MGTPETEHLAESYQMFKDLGMEQGMERTAKELAALGADPKGKAAKREGAAETRKAHAEQVTERAEPGATGTAPDASPAEEPKDKSDARHSRPPAGRPRPGSTAAGHEVPLQPPGRRGAG